MERTKGKLEIIDWKYAARKLVRQGDLSHKDILDDVPTEQSFANLEEITRRWNAFEKGGPVSVLLTACEGFMRFAGRDVPNGMKIDSIFLGELKDETHKIRQALARAKQG